MKTERQILPNLAMAVSFTNMVSTYYSHLIAAMKDWFFHLSHKAEQCYTVCCFQCVCVCVCVCVWERRRGRACIKWKRSNSWDWRNSCISSTPALLPSPSLISPFSPWMSPSHPFSDPPLPRRDGQGLHSFCARTHTDTLITIWAWVTETLLVRASVLLSEDKYRQDARAAKHSSID